MANKIEHLIKTYKEHGVNLQETNEGYKLTLHNAPITYVVENSESKEMKQPYVMIYSEQALESDIVQISKDIRAIYQQWFDHEIPKSVKQMYKINCTFEDWEKMEAQVKKMNDSDFQNLMKKMTKK